MNRDSNFYTFLFTIIMVFLVASSLATTASLLKDLQKENVRKEKMQNILSSIGILTPAFMRHYRRHSVIAILIVSSFITPPDPVSMLIMFFPLALLYEASIGVSWMVNKKRT